VQERFDRAEARRSLHEETATPKDGREQSKLRRYLLPSPAVAEQRLKEDLRRFKQIIETGETPTTADYSKVSQGVSR
jgi:hypothetical protein